MLTLGAAWRSILGLRYHFRILVRAEQPALVLTHAFLLRRSRCGVEHGGSLLAVLRVDRIAHVCPLLLDHIVKVRFLYVLAAVRLLHALTLLAQPCLSFLFRVLRRSDVSISVFVV